MVFRVAFFKIKQFLVHEIALQGWLLGILNRAEGISRTIIETAELMIRSLTGYVLLLLLTIDVVQSKFGRLRREAGVVVVVVEDETAPGAHTLVVFPAIGRTYVLAHNVINYFALPWQCYSKHMYIYFF